MVRRPEIEHMHCLTAHRDQPMHPIVPMSAAAQVTLTNSVQAVAEGRLDMAPARLIWPFL